MNVPVCFKALRLAYGLSIRETSSGHLALHVLACQGVGSVGAGVHRAVLEQVLSGQCWSRCSPGSVGAGAQGAVLEQVFSGQCWSRCSVGSVRAGVRWSSGQCWSRCLLSIWPVLDQVFIGHLASVRPGVHWTSGQY